MQGMLVVETSLFGEPLPKGSIFLIKDTIGYQKKHLGDRTVVHFEQSPQLSFGSLHHGLLNCSKPFVHLLLNALQLGSHLFVNTGKESRQESGSWMKKGLTKYLRHGSCCQPTFEPSMLKDHFHRFTTQGINLQ